MIKPMKIIEISLIIYFLTISLYSNDLVKSDNHLKTMILSSKSTSDAYRACVAIDSNETIHVVWKDRSNILNSGDDWDIFYRYKTKNKNWSAYELVTLSFDNDVSCLSMIVDKKNVIHVVWKDRSNILNSGDDWDIFYSYKLSDEPWNEPILISYNSTGSCSCPTIAIDINGDIHIVWSEINSSDKLEESGILYHKFMINKSWNDFEIIPKGSNFFANNPTMCIGNDNSMHVAWYEKRNSTNNELYYIQKLKNIWSKEILISDNCTGNSVDPEIILDDFNNTHIIWNDNSDLFNNGNDYDIFYRFKKEDKNFSPIQIISNHSISNCKWPYMQVENNVVYVSWSDKTKYVGKKDADYDIVLTKKGENDTWETPKIVSIESMFDSNWPRFVIDKNHTVHMTWWDATPSKWITYYSAIENEEIKFDQNIPKTIVVFLLTILIIIIYVTIKKYFIKKQ